MFSISHVTTCGGLGGGQYLGGSTRHFFSLSLYNFKNIGGGGGARACPAPPTPRSLLIMLIIDSDIRWFIDNVKCIINYC